MLCYFVVLLCLRAVLFNFGDGSRCLFFCVFFFFFLLSSVKQNDISTDTGAFVTIAKHHSILFPIMLLKQVTWVEGPFVDITVAIVGGTSLLNAISASYPRVAIVHDVFYLDDDHHWQILTNNPNNRWSSFVFDDLIEVMRYNNIQINEGDEIAIRADIEEIPPPAGPDSSDEDDEDDEDEEDEDEDENDHENEDNNNREPAGDDNGDNDGDDNGNDDNGNDDEYGEQKAPIGDFVMHLNLSKPIPTTTTTDEDAYPICVGLNDTIWGIFLHHDYCDELKLDTINDHFLCYHNNLYRNSVIDPYIIQCLNDILIDDKMNNSVLNVSYFEEAAFSGNNWYNLTTTANFENINLINNGMDLAFWYCNQLAKNQQGIKTNRECGDSWENRKLNLTKDCLPFHCMFLKLNWFNCDGKYLQDLDVSSKTVQIGDVV